MELILRSNVRHVLVMGSPNCEYEAFYAILGYKWPEEALQVIRKGP